MQAGKIANIGIGKDGVFVGHVKVLECLYSVHFKR